VQRVRDNDSFALVAFQSCTHARTASLSLLSPLLSPYQYSRPPIHVTCVWRCNVFLRQQAQPSQSQTHRYAGLRQSKSTAHCAQQPASNDRPQHDVYAAVHVCAKDSATVCSRIFGVYFIDTNFDRIYDKDGSFIDERRVAFPPMNDNCEVNNPHR